MTTLYNNFKQLLLNGGIDLDNDTIKMAVLSDSQSYTPDIDNEVFVDDVIGVSATEFSGTGYSRPTLSVSVSQDNGADEAVADATDLTLTGVDGDTIDSVLVYKEGTNDSDSPLIGHFTSADFPIPTNGGDVNLNIDASGLINLG